MMLLRLIMTPKLGKTSHPSTWYALGVLLTINALELPPKVRKPQNWVQNSLCVRCGVVAKTRSARYTTVYLNYMSCENHSAK